MDKLEQYLDQVCRRIGGPKPLRLHIRQELAEHLRDAAAGHRAAGMSEEAALAKALEEFGKPEEVRSELEATHGQRLLAVAIDKALDWKEMTMRAKWLWLTWAHLALMGIIALAVLWILFAVMLIMPKFQRLMQDGIIDPGILDHDGVSWAPGFLNGLVNTVGNFPIWCIVVPALVWGLFEWRVRSENKTFMRLSGLGTVALALLVVGVLTAATLVVCFAVGVPGMGRLARPYALDKIAHINSSISALEAALARKDWQAMQEEADKATKAMDELGRGGPVLPALAARNEPLLADLRDRVKTSKEILLNAHRGIQEKDLGKLETALGEFRVSYGRVREVAEKNQ